MFSKCNYYMILEIFMSCETHIMSLISSTYTIFLRCFIYFSDISKELYFFVYSSAE